MGQFEERLTEQVERYRELGVDIKLPHSHHTAHAQRRGSQAHLGDGSIVAEKGKKNAESSEGGLEGQQREGAAGKRASEVEFKALAKKRSVIDWDFTNLLNLAFSKPPKDHCRRMAARHLIIHHVQ